MKFDHEVYADIDKLFERVHTLDESVIKTMQNLVHLQNAVISLQDSVEVLLQHKLLTPPGETI